ncbi:suppressor of cytokine signaling 6 [Stegostoma tigrinum]|uniref:suppressor of cytokine signaling 6 n=1 Tax=Stegostoma tigrinum TaxID=3053191 RepID=UPI00202AD184|nr:suppressor of cytokine signaling 6 [Stegostoma tigrinum]XP_048385737.1 suppressor of cytokine signaling 6 [Stegostoma tigrinum]XP_048385738.1 suppressor of cytokine signaling 6 [Stegostoma tigrinum]XP_048385739.1 suppressor of cytokine signaling 6 [Stegostoma tigrinum]
MKKISLKTIKKSFNLNKGKDENEFVVVQHPSLVNDFGKEDSVFSCYGKDLAVNDLNKADEDDKGPKNKAKGEGLMGTLKRRLSAKQKQKGKGNSPSLNLEDDRFSSSSTPASINDLKAQRPLRSTSLRDHHYSPTPWPLRSASSEETCIKMEVKVKALVHNNSPNQALNGVRKEFHDMQTDRVFQEQNNTIEEIEPQNDNSNLSTDESCHVPVVIGLMPQNYIQYTMPLEEGMFPMEGSRTCCLDNPLPMEVSSVPSHLCSSPLQTDGGHLIPDLMVASDIFLDPPVNGLLIGTTGVILQNSNSNHVDLPPLSPLLPPIPNQMQLTFSGFGDTAAHVAERVRHHLNFDPNSAPGVGRVYDSVQNNGPMVVTSLTEELKKLAKQGWYWGPITRWEAEEKLANVPDGSFLVRDSSDDRYLLSLSFRSQGKTLHTRIEHSNGRFSFYEQPDVEGHTSIVELIEHSIKDSESGAFCYSRSRLPGSATYPVRLTNPVSRFMQVRSLQYLCRFVIRQYTRIDLIQKLPLPNKMKDYLQEKHY